jgi:hypothetical protein
LRGNSLAAGGFSLNAAEKLLSAWPGALLLISVTLRSLTRQSKNVL